MIVRTITLVESTSYCPGRTMWTATVSGITGGSVEAGYFNTASAALEWAEKQE